MQLVRRGIRVPGLCQILGTLWTSEGVKFPAFRAVAKKIRRSISVASCPIFRRKYLAALEL